MNTGPLPVLTLVLSNGNQVKLPRKSQVSKLPEDEASYRPKAMEVPQPVEVAAGIEMAEALLMVDGAVPVGAPNAEKARLSAAPDELCAAVLVRVTVVPLMDDTVPI